VLAGGRYDGLIEALGGPATPGIGWAAGIERLAMMLAGDPAPPRPFAVVPVGEQAKQLALILTHRLRHAGFAVDLGFGGNLKKRMKRADRVQARAAIILGDDELAKNGATLRDLDSGEQELVSLDDLSDRLTRFA